MSWEYGQMGVVWHPAFWSLRSICVVDWFAAVAVGQLVAIKVGNRPKPVTKSF
jgi:hypothetical protein